MKNKLLFMVLCVTMVGMMFIGCSKTPKTSETDATTKDSEPTAEPVAEEPTSQYAKAEGPIVYWSMWDAGSKTAIAIQEAIDAYCAASGNEVQVEWKGRDIQTLIGASIDAGENIDIYEDDFQCASYAQCISGEWERILISMKMTSRDYQLHLQIMHYH